MAVALAGAGAALAVAQDGGKAGSVRDLVFTVRDLDFTVASLDDSVARSESDRRVKVTLSADVLFEFDSSRLEPAARSRIAQAADAIRQRHPRRVRVDGYTDAKGTPAYNIGLSQRRARAVERELRRQLGPSAPPLAVRGHGEADPVAPNTHKDGSDDPRGRARNRRVEVAFAKG